MKHQQPTYITRFKLTIATIVSFSERLAIAKSYLIINSISPPVTDRDIAGEQVDEPYSGAREGCESATRSEQTTLGRKLVEATTVAESIKATMTQEGGQYQLNG